MPYQSRWERYLGASVKAVAGIALIFEAALLKSLQGDVLFLSALHGQVNKTSERQKHTAQLTNSSAWKTNNDTRPSTSSPGWRYISQNAASSSTGIDG